MDYLAVALAGFLGAVSRAFLGRLLNLAAGPVFPVSTLIINLTGCFTLSLLLAVTLDRCRVSDRLRLAAGTGFLGAYTTFSTFSVEAVDMFRQDLFWTALLYTVTTPVGCVIAAAAGARLGKSLTTCKTGTGE